PLAVVGRTKEQSRVGRLVAEMLQEIIGYDALRIRERVEHPGVCFREDRLNVIEGDREMGAAEPQQLAGLSPQARDVLPARTGEVQARRNGINEIQAFAPAIANQSLQFGRVALRVKLAPEQPMFQVV